MFQHSSTGVHIVGSLQPSDKLSAAPLNSLVDPTLLLQTLAELMNEVSVVGLELEADNTLVTPEERSTDDHMSLQRRLLESDLGLPAEPPISMSLSQINAAAAVAAAFRPRIRGHPQLTDTSPSLAEIKNKLDPRHQITHSTGRPIKCQTRKGRALSQLAKVCTVNGQGLKQGKLKGKAPSRCRNNEISKDELYYLDKFTLHLNGHDEYHKMTATIIPYYLFHPDRPYSNQDVPVRGWDEQEGKTPLGAAGKVHVHWYIALNQLTRFKCPLEASPEAWDTRGQRLIPIFEILESISGFNSKNQRDLMAQAYLLMYFRHVCGNQGGTDPIKVLRRLGIEACSRNFSPLVLLCTFCGQYSDVVWEHIDLFDKKTLAQEYLDKVRDGTHNGKVVRVGILSVLTCNHLNCTNTSANGVPRRRNYSGRRDDQDFFCQLSALKLGKGQNMDEMSNIVKNPTEYFPPHLGGDGEREKWRRLDLDENTVRYLRMEAYVMKVLNEYSDNCRLCGKYIPDGPSRKPQDMQLSKFAQKGNLCWTDGTCSWEDAVQKTSTLLEQELGSGWSVMVHKCQAMRRGALEELSPTESDESASSLFFVSPGHSDFSEPSDAEAFDAPQGNNPGGSSLDQYGDLHAHGGGSGRDYGEMENDAAEEIFFATDASIGTVLQQMDLDEDSWADVDEFEYGDCNLMDWAYAQP